LKSVERRHFGTKEGEEPKILIDNAAALYAQLALLDRRFFFCLDYEKLAEIKNSTLALQHELAQFLHEDEMAMILPEMIRVIRPSSSKPAYPTFILNDSIAVRHSKARHNNSQEYLAFQLQARLTLIDHLCCNNGGGGGGSSGGGSSSSGSSSSSSRLSKEKPNHRNEEKVRHEEEIKTPDTTNHVEEDNTQEEES
jgi:hypothetical protein